MKSILNKEEKKVSWFKKIYNNLFPKLKREIFIKLDEHNFIYKQFYTNYKYTIFNCFTEGGIIWRDSKDMLQFNFLFNHQLEAFYIKCVYDNVNYIEKENGIFTVKKKLTNEELQTYK